MVLHHQHTQTAVFTPLKEFVKLSFRKKNPTRPGKSSRHFNYQKINCRRVKLKNPPDWNRNKLKIITKSVREKKRFHSWKMPWKEDSCGGVCMKCATIVYYTLCCFDSFSVVSSCIWTFFTKTNWPRSCSLYETSVPPDYTHPGKVYTHNTHPRRRHTLTNNFFFSFPSSYCVVCNLWFVLSLAPRKNTENLGIFL